MRTSEIIGRVSRVTVIPPSAESGPPGRPIVPIGSIVVPYSLLGPSPHCPFGSVVEEIGTGVGVVVGVSIVCNVPVKL